MSRIWPADTIRELLTAAEQSGEAVATLESEDDAYRYRFAIYTFRKQNRIGEALVITLDGTKVFVRRPKIPSVQIDVPGGTAEEGV